MISRPLVTPYNFTVRTFSLSEALSQVLDEREKHAQIALNPRAFFIHVRVPEHISADLRGVQRRVISDVAKHEDIDHVTLVYTKRPLEDHPPEKVHAALESLRRIGARTQPIQASIQGWGYFDGAAKSGKPSTALVALLDAPGLEHLHVDMSRALKEHGIEASDLHVFTPHITLGYLGHEGRVEKLEPLSGKFTIDKAHVASRDHHEIPLTGHEDVGRKAAEFAMNPRDLRKEPKSIPGKGETSAVVGAATPQTGAMHSGGGFK